MKKYIDGCDTKEFYEYIIKLLESYEDKNH